MGMNNRPRRLLLLLKKVPLLIFLSTLVAITEIEAQKAEPEKIVDLQEFVVVGTRHQERTSGEAPVPVDIIDQNDLFNQGYTDLDTLLATTIPSFNVNTQPVSGSPSLVRPAYLRGLPGDTTLVLVNGKRRHRASIINIFGAGVTDGSHGPDLASIPAVALKRVEVLRDGASAQYGSDAIAGVLNFMLRDAPKGGVMEARWGNYYQGDGDTYTIAANIGLAPIESGFANLSFEYSKNAPTSRSVQRTDAQLLIDMGNQHVPVPAQHWGLPEINYDFKFFGNIGFDLGEDSQFYLFTNFAQREMEQGFWYRYPDGGRFFSAVAMLDDGSTYDPKDFFPGGFTPQFGGVATDMSLASGIRGKLDNSWSYDLSGVVGQHRSKFTIWNTVNPQLIHLKDNIPTAYEPGGYTEMDYTLNLDLSRPFDLDVFHSPLNVAFGFEYRVEQYEIEAGETNSWFDHSDDPTPPLVNWDSFGIGSDGFPGFRPEVVGQTDRGSYAAYLDLEADVSENVLVALAARYEDYDNFGDTLNGKLAARWQWTDNFALRGSLSTGFRVPTVGQANLVDVTSAYDEDGNLVNNGTLPPTHPASMQLGSTPLEPETSSNITIGAMFDVGDMNVSFDYYRIKMQDRIALTRQATLTEDQRDELIRENVPGADAIRTVRYFANDFDTTTQGIDLVADYMTKGLGGDMHFTLAANWNDTSVDKFNPNGIDDKRINQVERNLPKFRTTLTAELLRDPWQFLGRLRYYGDFFEYQADWVGWPIEAEARILVDAEVGYTVTDGIRLVAGARNLFNTYPTENPHARSSGARYPDSTPYGFSGGFYYFKVIWNFL